MSKSVSEWQNKFIETASRLADELVLDAKSHDTYGEATSFIKKLSGQAWGKANDSKDLATMKLNDAICECALHMIYEEERSLPIKRGED